MKRNKSLFLILCMLISFSVSSNTGWVNKNCSKAIEENRNIYRSCWGYDQNIILLKEILNSKETIEIVNSGSEAKKTEHVRRLLLSILPGNKRHEVDVVALQFAIDLYHSLPSGTSPPPSDITPITTDKGLLWRFDEPLGQFRFYCQSDLHSQMKKLCKYYFEEGNLDLYTKKARISRALFPSPNQYKVLNHMGLNEKNSIITLRRARPELPDSYKHYKVITSAAKINGCAEINKILWVNYRRDRRKTRKSFDVVCRPKNLELECDFDELGTCSLKNKK